MIPVIALAYAKRMLAAEVGLKTGVGDAAMIAITGALRLLRRLRLLCMLLFLRLRCIFRLRLDVLVLPRRGFRLLPGVRVLLRRGFCLLRGIGVLLRRGFRRLPGVALLLRRRFLFLRCGPGLLRLFLLLMGRLGFLLLRLVVPLLLCIRRNGYSEGQNQSCCAENSH